jgi:hypothetical protein
MDEQKNFIKTLFDEYDAEDEKEYKKIIKSIMNKKMVKK